MRFNKKDNWIYLRLPREDDLNDRNEVLVSTKDKTVRVATWTGSGFNVKGSGWCESTDVEAWAVMPKPYEKEGEDD